MFLNRLTSPSSWDSSHPEQLAAAQVSRLRSYLQTRVVPFSGHYGKIDFDARDLRVLDDLRHLPFTSKGDLHDRAREFVLIPDEKILARQPASVWKALRHGRAGAKRFFEREFRPIIMTSTTGRTAEPVPFLYTQHDLDNLAVTGRRLMEVGGSRPEYKHANLFPYAPHLAYWQAYHAGIAYNTFMVGTGGGKVLGTDGNIQLLDKVKPEVIIAMPTFLYHLLQEAIDRDRRWEGLKMLVLGGEKVPLGMRRKLRALCAELGAGQVDVLSTYGLTEAKAAFNECPTPPGAEPSGYHLSPDIGLVEIVDPETGERLPEDTPGEVVFTPLDARGTVVLRYRTGDLISGGLTHEPCPYCGRRCPRLVGAISRVSEFRRLDIHKLKGTLVNFNALEHALDDADEIRAWQVEIRKRDDDPYECDELHLLVTPKPGYDPEELDRQLRSRFHRATEMNPNRIRLIPLDEMQKAHGFGRLLKEEKIVDRRPQPEGSGGSKPGSSGADTQRKEAEAS